MKRVLFFFIFMNEAVFVSPLAIAETGDSEWYGEGYREPEWILEHGGTIIKYRIKGEEDSDDYKARLYLGETMMEIAHGGRAYFDDPINNRYKVIIFKGQKKKMDADVVARPGQEITLKFDLKKKKVETEVIQVVPLRDIRLNSGSSRYISAADLGREEVSREELAETVQEEQSLGPELWEREDEFIRDTLASFEVTFRVLRKELPEELLSLEQTRHPSYILRGPRSRVFQESLIPLQEGREALAELRHLAEGTPEGGMRDMLLAKVTDGERFLTEQTGQLEKERSKNFWQRLKRIF